MTRRKLREEDFPLEAEQTSVRTTDGTAVATTETPELARDVAERLNEDAARRHEDNWSA
jgi:hypothetical protein